MSFKEIAPEELKENAFKVIGKDWLLVTGTAEGKSNAMTASWGGMGVMWGKPVAFLVIRPQRYTKEFIDRAEGLTISVFGEDRRKMMSYFGSVSGRDEDKIAKAGLTPVEDNGRVYFEEANCHDVIVYFEKGGLTEPYQSPESCSRVALRRANAA